METVSHFYSALPDGAGGFTPCPELLTEDEAIRFLRLDMSGSKNPANTLKYYRDKKVLQAVQVGRKLLYPLKQLGLMVDRLLEGADKNS